MRKSINPFSKEERLARLKDKYVIKRTFLMFSNSIATEKDHAELFKLQRKIVKLEQELGLPPSHSVAK